MTMIPNGEVKMPLQERLMAVLGDITQAAIDYAHHHQEEEVLHRFNETHRAGEAKSTTFARREAAAALGRLRSSVKELDDMQPG